MVFERGGISVFLQKLVLLLSLSSQVIYQFIFVTSTIYDLHVSDSRHTELSAKTGVKGILICRLNCPVQGVCIMNTAAHSKLGPWWYCCSQSAQLT